MVLIISSFAGRCVFDFVRTLSSDWFQEMRANSYKKKNWNYAIFYFLLIVFIDYVPNILFIINLKFVWSKSVVLKKKMSLEGA